MKDWWQGAVIYQIYPRSFCDSNGDGVGDLNGITEKLDYVASLGVDGVWISPFFKSPMHDFGYDVADFRDVDPVFGTLEDFDRLLEHAHELGLKVIIDQVYSHASMECAWFKESKASRTGDKADWFVWADAKQDGSPPNNWQSVFAGPAWTWSAARKQYYFHNFLSEQPDLNVHNPEVQEELLSVARFWLERGVDGFRLDATNFYMHDPALRDNPPFKNGNAVRPFDMQDQIYNQSHPDIEKFLARLRGLMDSYGATFTVAEVGGRRSLEEMAAYTKGDKLLHTAYSFIFLEEEELTVPGIRDAIEDWDKAADSWPSWTFSNHDRRRVVSRWRKNRDPDAFAKAMNALLLSLKGTIFIYQGEELGLPQSDVPYERLVDPEAIKNWPETLGRDGCRTPMPWTDATKNGGWPAETWLPMDMNHFPMSVAAQETDSASSLAFTRRLLTLRKAHPALVYGDITFLDTPEPVLAFLREADGEKLLCVFNLGEDAANWAGHEGEPTLVLGVGGVDSAGTQALPVCGGFIAKL
ncbi:alpha-glucosidase family protein [Kordiimonas aestuarii]|uniref:alpha-glucosidase family protein n=1 Tax=Kordiimonas aestuarii TaxID=1005925 RepID=UPI0021D1BB88|nr:alpha-glucosidase family protein [Kordiimonas aestuarii]